MKTTIELSDEQAAALNQMSKARDVSLDEVIHQVLAQFLHDQNGEAESDWAASISQQWAEELSDSREDIYSLTDGEPIDEGR